MSLPPPQLYRLWTPPAVPASCCSLSSSFEVESALAALNARSGDANATVRDRPPSSSSDTGRGGGRNGPTTAAATITADSAARTDPSLSLLSPSSEVRMLTLHPTLPLAAYLVVKASSSTAQQQALGGGGGNRIMIVLQDLESGQVGWCATWTEIAACLYGERNASKLPAAVKSLGRILGLEFLDSQSVFWQGVWDASAHSSSINNNNSSNQHRYTSFSWLAVQTSNRVLVLSPPRWSRSGGAVMVNHSKAARSSWFVSHLHEKSLGAVPSSNLLALDPYTWLVGCSDGTLKVWDKVKQAPAKSIKGLGKGDWVVHIVAANRYSATSLLHAESSSSKSPGTTTTGGGSPGTASAAVGSNRRRRILTVTRRRSVYLIELEVAAHSQQLEMKPPLARFVLPESLAAAAAAAGADEHPLLSSAGAEGGGGSSSNDAASGGGASASAAAMEHAVVTYDAHRNWLQWFVPASKKNPVATLLIWNLTLLQSEFVKHQDNSKSLFRPDPTLTLQLPALPSGALDLSPGLSLSSSATSSPLSCSMTARLVVHTAFSEGTAICAVASSLGEIGLQAAIVPSSLASSPAKTVAAPVATLALSQLLMESLQLDAPPKVSVTSLHAQPLADRPLMVLVTNYGVMCLEWLTSSMPGWCTLPNGGTRHLHLGSGLGSLGKSVLFPCQSDILYSSLDIFQPNPLGLIDTASKNLITLYESPPPFDLPPEYQKRPFRAAPSLLPSPSGLYVAVLWASEFRYEVLHLPSLLQRVTQRNHPAGQVVSPIRNPLVASGSGVTCFAWVGDQSDGGDVYALLHAPHLTEESALHLASAPTAALPTPEGGLVLAHPGVGAGAGNNPNVVSNLANAAVKGATSATLSATKAAKDVTLNATKAAKDVTLTATKAATDATLKATKMTTKKVTKGVKKSFGLFGKKKKSGDNDGPSTITADEDDDEDDLGDGDGGTPNLGSVPDPLPSIDGVHKNAVLYKQRQYVELRSLVPLESQATELSASIPAATSSSLGELTLRGGNRNKPWVLFGGPVLIVASRADEEQEGHAHFYTRKHEEPDSKAEAYVSTGPTIPFPDLCEWDEDGALCAVATQNRIAIYLSDPPSFTLLGMLRLPQSSKIVSIKFVHGVFYCTTWNAVHCVFLGNPKGTGVCHMDMHTLASAALSATTETLVNADYSSIAPPTLPLPLVQPVVLGYQSGSLLLSTSQGIYAVPLSHPILRLGALLAAGQVDRAVKWLDAFPNRDHETLANFLERRGHIELATSLPGLSLETIVDTCMRFGYVGRLEEILEEYGLKGLRAIDLSRGFSSERFGPEPYTHSLIVCVGAYLLAHGKVEVARRLATEILRSGEDGRSDAFILASLMHSIDEADASRLIARAVEGESSLWPIGRFVRDHVLL